MPERSSDLEIHRDKFLNELTRPQPDLVNHQDFLKYWKMVEAEASQTEDLGTLDEWVREIARDKERVTALKNRTDTMTADPKQGIGPLAQILKMVLEALDAIERRLRRMREERFSVLAALLWKGGPGMLVKPPKKEEDKKKDVETGDEEPEQGAVAKKPDVKREKEKKMER